MFTRFGLLPTVLAGAALVTAWQLTPPPVRPADASPETFSAARALVRLEALLGTGDPHPVGSPEAGRIRDRVVADLAALGLRTEVQRTFVCGSYRAYCGAVENVVARIGPAGPAVVIGAHYDSQPATPGAADAMAGVASALEIARAWTEGGAGPPGGDLILLIGDGEEAGLLGAQAFVDEHPWAADAIGFVNLEARGTGGPSVPAYTAGPDLQVLVPYARGLGRRAPGSAITRLTGLLPAANDIAIFERLGIPAVTFGFARHIRRYHTPEDNLANLDARSVQQQGDAALRTARALALRPADRDTRAQEPEGLAAGARPSPSAGRGAFVSIGPVALAWPEARATPLALLALVLVLGSGLLLVRRREATAREVVWGLAFWPVAVVVTFFGAALLNLGRRSVTPFVTVWAATPEPTFFGFWVAAAGFVVAVVWALRRKTSASGLWIATWIWWSAGGVALARLAPAFAYLAFVPALAAGAAGSALAILGRRAGPTTGGSHRLERAGAGTQLAMAVPALVTLLVWWPQLAYLLELIGIGNLPPVAALVALSLTPAAPLALRIGRPGRWTLGLLAVGAMMAGVGARLPAFTADAPQWANLLYVEDARTGDAAVLYSGFPVPEAVEEAADFGESYGRALPWTPDDFGSTAPTRPLGLPAPTLDLETIDATSVRGRIRSPRGAPYAQLAFPAEDAPDRVTIAGEPVPPDEAAFPLFDDAWSVYTIWTLPPEGLEIQATWAEPAGAPRALHLADRTYAFPAPLAAIERARPPTAVPVGLGDGTIVHTQIALPIPDRP